MDAREFQKCVSKSFDFCKILKMREKIIKSANFLFGIVFYCSQKRCLQNTDRATLKVKIEDGREAP